MAPTPEPARAGPVLGGRFTLRLNRRPYRRISAFALPRRADRPPSNRPGTLSRGNAPAGSGNGRKLQVISFLFTPPNANRFVDLFVTF